MKIWRRSRWDGVLVGLSLGQLAATILLILAWDRIPLAGKLAGFVLLVFMMAYNIIVVSHLFTHVPWFRLHWLNVLMSMLNSVNMGQSVQVYEFTHVRNHHRYNNDAKNAHGTTFDTSSTYRGGLDGEHDGLLHYALTGALSSFVTLGRELISATRLWRVSNRETQLLALTARAPARRRREVRQVQFDRMAHCLLLLLFAVLSWQWLLLCYVPAFFVALVLVNVQNYYRHYGARPGDRSADSVSYYGRVYNLLTFNDGYHQEHHLCPRAHWSQMPAVRVKYQTRLERSVRVVSPVPAMVGFLDRNRPALHRTVAASLTSPE